MEVIVQADLGNIKNIPTIFRRGAEKGVAQAIIHAEMRAKQTFTESRGPKGGLHVRTGHLRRGIRSGSKGIDAWLQNDVIYASSHEEGATIKPKKSKYLKFPIRGKWVSVRQVVIPQRKFVEPGITENISKIHDIIVTEIIKEVDK